MNVSGLVDFAPRKYTEELTETEGLPVSELTALAPRDGLEMPVENLDDLMDQVIENRRAKLTVS